MTTSVAVVGGGIVGTAVAHRLLERFPDCQVTVFDKEDELGSHQTTHNSGVVHAGLYYVPGSIKATLCRRGVGLLREFCSEHDVAYRAIGKVLVAVDDRQAAQLGSILERSIANGVPGVRLLSSGELLELEPHVRGVAALHSPTTAIADFGAVTRVLGRLVGDAGGTILTGHRVTGLRHDGPQVRVSSATADGERDHVFDRAILCGGLQSDRLARLVGGDRYPAIVPFRGEYLSLVPDRRDLVNGLVYPVPDPRYPFLGTHFTPRVDGEVLIGPNAVLALAREGYRWSAVSARDLGALATAPGFWRFAARHWRTGIYEVRGSLVRKAFIARARQYVPGLSLRDVVPGPRGVRAQAMSRHGDLLDDFDIQYGDRVVAVRNAPSPAATSALAIAEHVISDVSDHWRWS